MRPSRESAFQVRHLVGLCLAFQCSLAVDRLARRPRSQLCPQAVGCYPVNRHRVLRRSPSRKSGRSVAPPVGFPQADLWARGSAVPPRIAAIPSGQVRFGQSRQPAELVVPLVERQPRSEKPACQDSDHIGGRGLSMIADGVVPGCSGSLSLQSGMRSPVHHSQSHVWRVDDLGPGPVEDGRLGQRNDLAPRTKCDPPADRSPEPLPFLSGCASCSSRTAADRDGVAGPGERLAQRKCSRSLMIRAAARRGVRRRPV